MSIVMKFGGTSVGSAEAIAHVACIIKSVRAKKPVVVVSAITKMTDALIRLANEATTGEGDETLKFVRDTHSTICKELKLPPALLVEEFKELEELVYKTRTKTLSRKNMLDHFQSFGERMCAKIVAAELERVGVSAKAFPAWDVGMITNDEFGDAEPLSASYALIKKKIFALKVVPVVTGFIGKTKAGEITTFGRGGSDYTAAIIGAAIGAERIQIWKEVDGFMTTDPRLVPEARVIPELAFEEASELAYFGARVLHPKTILPAMKVEIPVEVLNTFKPESKGTLIVSNFEKRKLISQTIDALTYKKDISLIRIYSPEFFDGNKLIADIFNLFGDYNVNIGDIALSVASVTLVLDNSDELPQKLMNGLKKIGTVNVDRNKAMVCVVGGSINTAKTAGNIFSVLGKNNTPVEFIAQASSGYSITFVVSNKDAEKTIKVLHKEFIKP